MDLRRIVEEVEERKREQYAYAPPPKPRAPGASGGLRASILETVRDRMLREDPTADVTSLTQVIEPARSSPPPSAPHTKLAGEPAVATIAREAARTAAKAEHPAPHARKTKDDFLARYLVMSEEFEKRYKVKGWTDLARKKCSSDLRP
jgi:hypothetical protein